MILSNLCSAKTLLPPDQDLLHVPENFEQSLCLEYFHCYDFGLVQKCAKHFLPINFIQTISLTDCSNEFFIDNFSLAHRLPHS